MARRLSVLLLLAAFTPGTGGCAPPPNEPGSGAGNAADSATVTGSVSYRERIALPPNTVVHVLLRDLSQTEAPDVAVAEQTIRPEGRQVPIPFALSYDPAAIDPLSRYVVSAEIRDGDGTPLWATPTKSEVITHGAPTEGVEVIVRRVSGGSESSGGQPLRSVWEDAGDRGVTFRAVGNEPGWLLEIVPGRWIRFTHSYGEREVVTPVPKSRVDEAAGRTTYHAITEAHDLRVVILRAPCSDSMSGEAFEATVTVSLDGATYGGCGRSLT